MRPPRNGVKYTAEFDSDKKMLIIDLKQHPIANELESEKNNSLQLANDKTLEYQSGT